MNLVCVQGVGVEGAIDPMVLAWAAQNSGLVIWPSLSIRLKLTTREAGLANDRLQSADAHLVMVGDGNSDSTLGNFLLHYDVAALAATNFFETGFSQNSANLLAGEEGRFNQPLPPPG